MFLDWLDRVYLVVHSPFNLNLIKPGVEWMVDAIKKDLQLVNHAVPLDTRSRTGVVVHLGKNTEQLSFDECVEHFSRNVEQILSQTDNLESRLILETSVKSKNDMFWSVESLGKLSQRLKSLLGQEVYDSRIGYCIDTAHVFASGYDIRTEDGMREYLRLFDDHIGVKRVTLLHLNDSKVGLGCCRDLHQQLGKGELYSEETSGVKYLLEWCQGAMVPVILETGGDWEEELEWLSCIGS
jgi:deoxyribonuclease-4